MKKRKNFLNGFLFMATLGLSIMPISANESEVSNESMSYPVVNETTFTMGRERSGYKTTLRRGNFLLWSKDTVYFNTNSSRITSSYGDQEWGWMIPNYIEGRGINKVSSSNTQHTYSAKKYITAGIPTPWGAIGPYGATVTDYIRVNQNGSVSWW